MAYAGRAQDGLRRAKGGRTMIMRGRSERGISILEIMIALVILAVAILMLMSLMLSSNRLQQNGREKSLAYNFARQKIEELRSYPVGEIYARFNSDAADNLSKTDPGATFTVPGLNPPDTGNQGEIFFPEEGGAISETLKDAAMSKTLGMPKDLNRNGTNTDTLASAAVKILPVLIRIRWETQGGKVNQLEVATLISDREE